MEYIIRGLCYGMIPLIIFAIFTYMKRRQKTEEGKVYLHSFLLIIGIIETLLFTSFAIVAGFSGESIWLSVVFLLFSVLGDILIVAFINCRVSYDEQGFTYTNFFGVIRSVTYDQVTAIKENVHEQYIYMGKHRVMIDEFSIGGREFIKLVKKKYRTLHNGQPLPQNRKTSYDLFNGHIKDATGFLVIYIAMAVLLIGLVILSLWVCFWPHTVNNTIEQSVCFVSCDIQSDEVVLTSADHQVFKISPVDETINTQGIYAVCNGQDVVMTYSDEVTPEETAPYYSLKAMVHNNTYLLSFDETNRLKRQEGMLLVISTCVLCLFWGAHAAMSVVVGRNPQKYSKWFVRLFFKDGYINN